MITVGLPVYNQTKVLHIALEGLCRQVVAGEWELIVSSEDNVWPVVDKYREKLKEAGCVNVIYDKLTEWIPLPKKWQRIGKLMSSDSLGMILQAADCYSHPDRIKQSKIAMIRGYAWYNETIGYFYYIDKKKLVKYRNLGAASRTKTHLNMCVAAKYAKALPDSDIKAGVDSWMFRTIPEGSRRIKAVNKSHAGVDLHGMNNISKKRGQMIEQCLKAFVEVEKTIDTIGLPKEVAKQIKAL